MKKLIISLVAILGLLIFQSCSHSSSKSVTEDEAFTGKIQVSAYKVIGNKEKKISDYSLVGYFTPQRIRFMLPKSMGPKEVTIRNDKGDIIYFIRNDKAIKISKDNINTYNSLIDAIKAKEQRAQQNSGNGLIFKKTGKTKNINGYQCEQFKMVSKNASGGYLILWMTKDLNINWGFISNNADIEKLALRALGIRRRSETPMANSIINDGYFPILLKRYRKGLLAAVLKVRVTATDEAKSHVGIPSDVKIIDVENFLKEALRQKQSH